jgi:hypothetical protein
MERLSANKTARQVGARLLKSTRKQVSCLGGFKSKGHNLSWDSKLVIKANRAKLLVDNPVLPKELTMNTTIHTKDIRRYCVPEADSHYFLPNADSCKCGTIKPQGKPFKKYERRADR